MPDQRKKKKNAPQGYIPAPGDQPRTGEQGQMNDQQQEMHDQIEQSGSVTPMEGRHAIHCLTIIGQIEGHYDARPRPRPQNMSMSFRSWLRSSRTPASRDC